METTLYIAFVVTSAALVIVPGPNVLVIVSTSLCHGTTRGLQTVLGTSSAMMIQLGVAAMGTTWFVASMAEGFEWLRWGGVAYLAYLGVGHLSNFASGRHHNAREVSASGSFTRGFVVSLTNPKTIVFFGAFLPQFVSGERDYLNQILVLSMTFLVVATVLDSLYAIVAGRVKGRIQTRCARRIQDGVSGVLFLSAGA